MKTFNHRLSLVLIGFIFFNIQIKSQIYDWRGPDRSGIYNETGLLKNWPDSGPELIWKAEDLGFGYSSVTITDDVIYITGRKDTDDVITALNLEGEKKWEVKYGKAWTRNHDGTRCTPTYVNGNIFLISGSGDIVCLTTDGNIKWSRNHYKEYESRFPMFGVSESPLYVDNKIIASPGGNKASVVAYNADNGNVEWEAEPLNEKPQYINPLLIKLEDKKIIVSHTTNYVIGLNASDGQILWKVHFDSLKAGNQKRDRINQAITPFYKDNCIFVSSSYNHINAKLELSPDGTNVKIVWKNSDIDPNIGGIVVLGNYLFGSNDPDNSNGDWICIDWLTGETLWKADWYRQGSIISADNMLYIFEEKSGHVGLMKPDEKKMQVISEFQIEKDRGPYWSHPVIRDGRLYIRHGEVLTVYSVNSSGKD